ncbi:MAG: hypothetical protein ACK452_08780, partial [Bacteroidota bacterium]
AIIFKNYFILIIPVFLFFRLKGLNSMKELRQKLQEKGIDCRLGFEELNNKQYWMLRKGLNEINQLPINEENVNEFTESIYEKLIVQNMKLVLVDLPYDNLSKKKKLIFTLFWVLIFIIPISILISLIYLK